MSRPGQQLPGVDGMEPGVVMVGPIGGRVAVWRGRRGLSAAALAAVSGEDHPSVDAIENGDEWVDRRGLLADWAEALRLDPAELTGQPYPPTGAEHAAVRAVAFQLRRMLDESGPVVEPIEMDHSITLAVEIRLAEHRGDELSVAQHLPSVIASVDHLAAEASGAAAERLEGVRVDVHVAASGLLRRLGYRDLAWLLLHRAAPGRTEPVAVLAEEVRLLLDLGWPEYALARAERVPANSELNLLMASAHAMAGRPESAHELLDACVLDVETPQCQAAVAGSRVTVAVETREFERATGLYDAVELDALGPADQVVLSISASSAFARTGDMRRAVELLVGAHEQAPLRFALDPFARELLAALPERIADPTGAGKLRDIAMLAGVS